MESVRCNICSASDYSVLYRWTASESVPDGSAARITTDIYNDYGQVVKCRKCGLVYRNPRPSEDVVIDEYVNMTDETYLLEDNSRAINAHLSLLVIKQFVREGRLLDVGCFTGYLLNAARLNFEGTGVEASEWAASIVRNRLGLNVLHGAFETVNLPEASFDVITMVDVIEHFSNPLAVINKAAGLLRPGGYLYLVTPNIKSLSARILRSRWWGLRASHLYYFSPGTLRRLLEQNGFNVIRQGSYGRVFTYAYWLSRLKNYPRWIYNTVGFVIRSLGVEKKVAYINTFDSMEVCAVKKVP